MLDGLNILHAIVSNNVWLIVTILCEADQIFSIDRKWQIFVQGSAEISTVLVRKKLDIIKNVRIVFE